MGNKEKEEAIAALSFILKEIASGRYEPKLWYEPDSSPKDKALLKAMSIRGLQLAMNELAKDLDYPADLKAALVMSESDLERFCHVQDSC